MQLKSPMQLNVQRCPGRASRGVLRVVAASAPNKPGQQSLPTQTPKDAQRLVKAAAVLTTEEVATLIQAPVPREARGQEAASRKGGASAAAQDMAWVFSYGGNMLWESLARREVSVSQRDAAFVVDSSIRMVFKHRGGHATLEPMPAGSVPLFRPPALGASQGQPCVHGVLYRIPAADLKHMESRDQGYVLSQMQVETYGGSRVLANVWVSGPLSRLPQEVVPPEMYMKKLREGAAFNFLDPAYQAWLSSIETVTSAGLGSEYYNTPGRYISYSLLMVSLTIVGGWLSQHL